MESLSEELLLKILTFVPPLELLGSVSLVSKHFSALVASETFWHHHPSCPLDHKEIPMNFHQIQRCCVSETETRKNFLPRSLRCQSLLPTREEALRVMGDVYNNVTFRCCAASTTHHYGENLVNVLYDPNDHDNSDNDDDDDDDDDSGNQWQMWWSSFPSQSSDSTDTILFACRYPLVILSKLLIKPLRDPHRHHASYTWKQTIVRAYRYPVENHPCISNTFAAGRGDFLPFCVPSIRSDRRDIQHEQQARGNGGFQFGLFTAPPDQATIDGALQGLEPVYESDPFSIPDNNHVVAFDFSPPATALAQNDNNLAQNTSKPRALVANLVTIDLIGKNHEQFEGQGYYSCVERVKLLGVPLLQEPQQARHLLVDTQ